MSNQLSSFGRTSAGRSPLPPLAKWNPTRDCWETTQQASLFSELLDVFSETWPSSGSMRRSAAYERPTWEPATSDSASSSSHGDEVEYLLTPVAAEGTKPSNTMGVTRRQATGQVFLTNQIVTLMGLDPTEA